MPNPTISQVTKCVKRNKQNIKITLNECDEFTQGTEFIIYREKKDVDDNSEIKTISSNILNDTSSIINYNLNEIIDVPNKLDKIFDSLLGSNYYLFGVNKTNSFLLALLYVISKEFKLKTFEKQSEFAVELLKLLKEEIPTFHRKNKYSSLGFKQTEIESSLENNNITEGVLCYLSDYYNINLIILDYNREKYIIGKEYNDSLNEKNVIIVLNNGIYLPLVNMFGAFPSKLLYKCIVNKLSINKEIKNISVKEFDNKNQTNTEVVDTNSAPLLDSSNEKNKLKLKAVSSYKLSDLQELAKSNNISIDDNGKKKTKNVLYQELLLV